MGSLSEGTDWWLLLKILVALGVVCLLFMSQGAGALLILLLLAVGAVIFVFVFVLLSLIQTYYANWFATPQRAEATVLWKETREYDYSAITDQMPFLWQVGIAVSLALVILREILIRSECDFWVRFQIGEKDLDFRVPEGVYANLEEGEKGILTSKGERLVHFQPTERPPAPKPTPESPPGPDPSDTPGGWRGF
jgi:hypothetical protein